MVTFKTRDFNYNPNGNKPTANIANGSILIEMDTGKIYMFNEADSAWVELA